MTRAVFVTGGVLVAFGLSIFLAKTVWLGLPLVPTRAEHLWGVELEVSARGIGGRGSVRAVLPPSERGQVVFDERTSSDRLTFTIRQEGEERIGIWRGRVAGTRHLVHGFRVELPARAFPLEEGTPGPPPPEIVEAYGESTAVYPALAFEVQEWLRILELPSARDASGRLRTLFAFVSEEVALSASGSDDALLTLASREGSAAGKTRLLVTLLRGAGIPARTVLGLSLRADRPPARVLWAEAWIHGDWRPAFVAGGPLGGIPADHLVLGYDRLEAVEATGVEAVSHRHRAIREQLSSQEIAAMMTPDRPVLARISLYGLPFASQAALRVLLLLPLGALLTAVYRNLVGVVTFGTFMPTLIALALRESSLAVGVVMVAAVMVLGIVGRLLLGRLQLLLVPRLSVLLCLVVLTITGFALVGRNLGSRDLGWGVLLPIVILTMLIERFAVSLAEEGARNTLVKAFWSLVVAFSIYPVFRSDFAAHVVFGYPELLVVTMGLLVWIGGYTGYRVSELFRFRGLAGPAGSAP